jgi:hypothetical protein
MNKYSKYRNDITYLFSIKIIVCVYIFSLILILFGSVVTYQNSLVNARNYLLMTTQRVKEDIKYANGSWDTSQYNSDTVIPDVNPLYVIASDGFVIERWKPINGFLDVAEFSRLLSYDKPETIKTITNENWRIYSKPIVSDGNVVGVINVSFYKPENSDLVKIDSLLKTTVSLIKSELSVNQDNIYVGKIDARQIPYLITFQIVNRFNELLFHNDNTSSVSRSPSFIDSSYVENMLSGKQEQYIQDSVTHKNYLVRTTPILDPKNNVVGIIVAGSPITPFSTYFYNNRLISVFISLLLLFGLQPVILLMTKKYRQKVIDEITIKSTNKMPDSIMFKKETSTLSIDNYEIQIPYSTYQYYFCKILFSKPQKRWETDEIIEKFGEEFNTKNWRKVYDTMVLLNKKTSIVLSNKLFIVEDKTFKINPYYLSIIK